MKRMVSTYHRVHNNRYWKELEKAIAPKILNGATVLDLGCGPGLLLKDIGQKYSPSKLIGLDLSDIMLDRARKEFETLPDDIDFELIRQHLQEDSSLPTPVDIIFSSRVMRSFEDQADIMTSMYNSLREGGYLVILDWASAPIQTYAEWFNTRDNEFDDLTPADVIRYHRNFSRYNLQDWHYITNNFGFEPIHLYQLDPVHSCIIAKKV